MIRRAALLLAAAVATASCGGDDRELVGYPRDPAPRVDAVTLPDVSRGGEPFAFRAEPGGLLVVYFGYTNCPDVCPATFAAVTAARRDLGDDADRVDTAMVTIDPARDTDVLAEFVQGFVADAHAIATDDDAALRSVADAFGVNYYVTDSGGEIEVGHTDSLFAVDETGTLALTWPAGTTSDDLGADLAQLLDAAAAT